MKLELYVHKILRILLVVASVAYVALGSYIAFLLQVTTEVPPLLHTTDSIVLTAVIMGCFTLSALCIAVALFYRKPLRELSHDALMADMEGMVKNSLHAVFAGVFTAVPAHRRADEVARYMSSQVQGLDARIAAILGKLGEAFLNATEGMGEAELLKIQQKLDMVLEMEEKASCELESVHAIIQEMENKLARFEILSEGNDTLHSELSVTIADIHRRMERLARHSGTNVEPFRPKT